MGQGARVSLSLSRPGVLTVSILDRDGFLVRTLADRKAAGKGTHAFDWNGKSNAGDLVPDEAYSLKIDLASKGRSENYFPANAPGAHLSVEAQYYDSQAGILSYKLPKAARVHVQAGSARVDSKTGQTTGPVLKTLVNREPRAAGSVIESWDGLDESRAFRVPDLANFVVAVAATALPESSIITTGNRNTSFLDSVSARRGKSLLTFSVLDHHHHRGLTVLDDVAPKIRLAVENGRWSPQDRRWLTNEKTAQVSVFLDGPSAKRFARQPGRLMVFLDREPISEVRASLPPVALEVPLPAYETDVLTLTVNWVSDYGPVAVNSLQLVPQKVTAASRAFRQK